MLYGNKLMSSGAFHARGCRWRAAPSPWNAGAGRRGIEVERLDEANVVVRWRLQRVRALAVPPLGPAENLNFAARFAQDGVFFRTRNKPEGLGGGKAGPRDAILHERMEDS